MNFEQVRLNLHVYQKSTKVQNVQMSQKNTEYVLNKYSNKYVEEMYFLRNFYF